MLAQSNLVVPTSQVFRTIQLLVRLPGVTYATLVVNAPDPARGLYDSETRQVFTPGTMPESITLPPNAKSATVTAGGVVDPEFAVNEAALLSHFCRELKPDHRMQLAGLAVELLGPGDEGIHYRVERKFKPTAISRTAKPPGQLTHPAG